MTKDSKLFYLFLFLISSLLPGCTGLQPLPNQSLATYIFNVPENHKKLASSAKHTILVSTPKANPGYTTSAMVYTDRNYEIKHFAMSKWAESPSHLLIPVLTQAIQNSGAFKAAVNPPFTGTTTYRLDTQLIRLQQDFLEKPNPSRIHMSIRIQLVNVSTQTLIHTKRYDAIETSLTETPYGGVIATNQLVEKITQQIAADVAKWVKQS